MKALVAVVVLVLAASASAQPQTGEKGTAETVKDLILGINPIILLAAGILLFLASNLAKLIAVLLIIIGLAGLILSVI